LTHKHLILIFFLGWATIAMGQENVSEVKVDTELWTGGEAKISFNKWLRFETDYQYRIENDPIEKKQSFTQFAVRIKILKWLYVKPSYRLVRTTDINKDRNRFSADLYFKVAPKKSKLEITNRFRYQYYTIINQARQGNALRNKISVSYNASKKFDPIVSGELFFEEEEFSTLRLKFGVDWKINKRFAFSPFYGYEQELGKKTNDKVHIIGLMASFNFKVKKEEK
jgi:hypothetical protein